MGDREFVREERVRVAKSLDAATVEEERVIASEVEPSRDVFARGGGGECEVQRSLGGTCVGEVRDIRLEVDRSTGKRGVVNGDGVIAEIGAVS